MSEKYKDFIGIYENAVSKSYCNEVISFYESKSNLAFDSQEHYGGPHYRKDASIHLEDFDERYKDELDDIIMDHIDLYKTKYFSYQNVDHHNFALPYSKVQKTDPRGGYHVWHCEIDHISHISRSLVWMIYLNDIPNGEGETEFLWQGLRVQPKAGTLLIWPSQFTHVHRGNPVYSCSKYIATGWIEYADILDQVPESPFCKKDTNSNENWRRKIPIQDRDSIQSDKPLYKRFVDLN